MKNHRRLLYQIGLLLILGVIFSFISSVKSVSGTASTTSERLQYLKEKRLNSENKLKILKARREQLLKLLSSLKKDGTVATTSTTTQVKIIPIEIPPVIPPTIKATTTITTSLPPVQVPPVQIKASTTNTTSNTNTNTTTNTTTNTSTNSSTNTATNSTSNTTVGNTSTVPTTNTFGMFGATTVLKPTVSSNSTATTLSGVAGKKVTYSINYSFPISYFTLEIKCDTNIKAYKYDSSGNPITSGDACGSKEKIVSSGGVKNYIVGYVNSEPTATPRQATIVLQAFNSSDQIQGSTVNSSLYISK